MSDNVVDLSIIKNIHLIGVGGDGMSALAGLLIDLGKNISGSDQSNLSRVKQRGLLEKFQKAGAKIYFGHESKNVPDGTQLVVRSSIINQDNPEIIEAERRNIPVVKRSVAVGMLMKDKLGLAIAGGAGKSSTTAMIGYILSSLSTNPTIYLGARMLNFDNQNYLSGKGKYFVTEADEFDRSFLDLKADGVIITNIFFADHVDYYHDVEETRQAFIQLLRNSKFAVVNGDSEVVVKSSTDSNIKFETFGKQKTNDWYVENIQQSPDSSSFDIFHQRKIVAKCQIATPGIHNILNALAAIALLNHYEFSPEKTALALKTFRGINRRLEKRGVVNGVTLYDDYGHNQVQIDAAIEGLRQIFPTNNIYAVFQPRQYQRTRLTLPEIINSFKTIKTVSVLDISYGIGDTEADKQSIHARDVVQALNGSGKQAVYNATFEDTVRWLKSVVKPGDVIITFGTGNPYLVTNMLLTPTTS